MFWNHYSKRSKHVLNNYPPDANHPTVSSTFARWPNTFLNNSLNNANSLKDGWTIETIQKMSGVRLNAYGVLVAVITHVEMFKPIVQSMGLNPSCNRWSFVVFCYASIYLMLLFDVVFWIIDVQCSMFYVVLTLSHLLVDVAVVFLLINGGEKGEGGGKTRGQGVKGSRGRR